MMSVRLRDDGVPPASPVDSGIGHAESGADPHCSSFSAQQEENKISGQTLIFIGVRFVIETSVNAFKCLKVKACHNPCRNEMALRKSESAMQNSVLLIMRAVCIARALVRNVGRGLSK